MNSKEIKNGAMLSYLLIIVNTCYGLFFTPFLISSLQAETKAVVYM